jgi:hypothetical protein
MEKLHQIRTETHATGRKIAFYTMKSHFTGLYKETGKQAQFTYRGDDAILNMQNRHGIDVRTNYKIQNYLIENNLTAKTEKGKIAMFQVVALFLCLKYSIKTTQSAKIYNNEKPAHEQEIFCYESDEIATNNKILFELFLFVMNNEFKDILTFQVPQELINKIAKKI